MSKQYHTHNELKIKILCFVFDEYKTAAEITTHIYGIKKGSPQWLKKYGSVLVRLHSLSKRKSDYYITDHKWKPYLLQRPSKTILNSATGRPVYEYKANAKGRRVCCELRARQRQGTTLKWTGINYRFSGCQSQHCSTCPDRPVF